MAEEPLATRPRMVALNALSGYAPMLVTGLSGLILTPIVVRGLGTNGYGVRSLAIAAIAYVGILDAGIGTAVVTRVAHALPSAKQVERITRTATATFLPLCALSAIVGAVLAWFAPDWFSVHGDANQVRATFAVIALWQIFNILLAVPSGALQGGGRFGSLTMRGTAITLIAAVAQAVIAVVTRNVVGVAIAIAASGVLTFLVSDRLARRLIAGYTLSPRGGERAISRDLFRLGANNAVVYIAGSAGYGSDIVIVGVVSGTRAAAIYAIASRASQFATILALQIATTLSGSYATLSAQGQLQRAWTLCVRATSVSLLVLTPMAIALIGFGRGLLVDWVGHVGGEGYAVLVILVVVGAVQLCGHNAFILITGIERSELLTKVSVASAVLNVALSVGLTKWIGITGPAYGSLVTATFIDLIVIPPMAARLCGAQARSLLPVYARLVPPTLLGAGVAVLIRATVGGTGAVAVLGAAASAAAFGLGCLVNSTLRAEFAEILQAVRSRAA